MLGKNIGLEGIHGAHFNKRDIDRCGLFSEIGYLITDKYKPQLLQDNLSHGKRFFVGASPTKCGIQSMSGYFDPTFKTIYVNDKYRDPWKREAALDKSQKKWSNPPGTKTHSTPGDYYGTFTEKLQAFSPQIRPAPPQERNLKSMLSYPPRKGGPGFANITLSPYPEYKSEKYNAVLTGRLERIKPMILCSRSRPYFDENPFKEEETDKKKKRQKKLRISEARPKRIFVPPNSGSYLNKFPPWQAEKYNLKAAKEKIKVKFDPCGNPKSFYTVSTIKKKLASACNETNYRTLRPITYPL